MTTNDQMYEDLAKTAYRAYGSVTSFKNYQGNPMPEFDDLPETIKKAWIQVAKTLTDKDG